MFRSRTAFLLFLLATAAGPVKSTAVAKETAELVYEKVHPSVVSLQNAEGLGTGILLDRAENLCIGSSKRACKQKDEKKPAETHGR